MLYCTYVVKPFPSVSDLSVKYIEVCFAFDEHRSFFRVCHTFDLSVIFSSKRRITRRFDVHLGIRWLCWLKDLESSCGNFGIPKTSKLTCLHMKCYRLLFYAAIKNFKLLNKVRLVGGCIWIYLMPVCLRSLNRFPLLAFKWTTRRSKWN